MRAFILAFALALLRQTKSRSSIEVMVNAMLDGMDDFIRDWYGKAFPSEKDVLAENAHLRKQLEEWENGRHGA